MQISKTEVQVIVVKRMAGLRSEHDTYDLEIWKQIFIDVFGEKPNSIEDERWDTLLLECGGAGYGALNMALAYFDSLIPRERAG